MGVYPSARRSDGCFREATRPCFVDLDPQGNATEGLGLVEAYDSEPPNLFDVVAGHQSAETMRDLIEEQTEMDVVPNNVDMLNAERALIIADYEGEDSFAFLHDAVRALEKEYDVALIDFSAILRAVD